MLQVRPVGPDPAQCVDSPSCRACRLLGSWCLNAVLPLGQSPTRYLPQGLYCLVFMEVVMVTGISCERWQPAGARP